jgi:hypothetical protein
MRVTVKGQKLPFIDQHSDMYPDGYPDNVAVLDPQPVGSAGLVYGLFDPGWVKYTGSWVWYTGLVNLYNCKVQFIWLFCVRFMLS